MLEIFNNSTSAVISIIVIITSFIGAVGWFIRLESKVLYLERDHEKNNESLWKEVNDNRKQTSEVLLALGRIEGKIEVVLTKE